MFRHWIRTLCVGLLTLPSLLWSPAQAGEPAIRNLNIRGLQVGGTTTIILEGDELGTAPKLLLPFATKQTLLPKNTDKQASFEVQIDKSIPSGLYPLSVVTDQGVSPPTIIAVDPLPQLLMAPTIEQVPCAVHGTISGSTVSQITFPGKAGQKLQIEIEAQRLAGKLRPVIHLYNSKQLQLAWAWPQNLHGGDARLEATLPTDGKYNLTIHDVEYAGQAPGHFRIKIGQWNSVEQVFPPVIGKDYKAPIELLPGGQRSELPATGASNFFPLPWPKEGIWSGARPHVRVSTYREVTEQPTAKDPQLLPAIPVGVSGKLLTEFEEDRYRLPVEPGSKIRLEVFAERYGSPLDTALVLRDDQNKELVRAEDSPGSLDPVLEYTVPEKITSVIVGVVDSQGRGSSRGLYRLVVENTKTIRKGNLQVLTPNRSLSLPTLGKIVVPIWVDRQGENGPLTLQAQGFPKGVQIEGTLIPDGAEGTLLTLQRDNTAAEPGFARFQIQSGNASGEFVRIKGHPLEKVQPWLAMEIPVAFSSAKGNEFQVDWKDLPADAGLVPASKLNLPVKLTRPMSANTVRLTLVTSQLPPLVNNQPDTANTIRAEKPVELAANIAEGALTVLTPPLLNSKMYDVSVQAELIGPDKKTVLATAFTPVRRMAVRLPIEVLLNAPVPKEVTLDAKTGATVKFAGKVERKEGFAGDVTLTVTGLPPGAKADPVTVKAGVNDFTVNLVLAVNTPPGELPPLKLVGSIVPDPKQANIKVQSRDIEIPLLVRPAPK